MSRHHTKSIGRALSQTSPLPTSDVACGVTLEGTYVLLCDWHGKLVWKSAHAQRIQVGDPIWKNASGKSREQLRDAAAGVTALSKVCTLEVDNDRDQRFRLWMWPLNEPDFALCVLAVRVPKELALLTDRERECLRLLGQGKSTRDISGELEIGLTTVHTHLRRSREKLGLSSVEELISFAARYLAAPMVPPAIDAVRKASG